MGQAQQALGAAIDVGARLEPLDHEPFELSDRPVPPPQLVVQRENLDDQSRAQAERRRRAAAARDERRAAEDHFTLGLGEPRRG